MSWGKLFLSRLGALDGLDSEVSYWMTSQQVHADAGYLESPVDPLQVS